MHAHAADSLSKEWEYQCTRWSEVSIKDRAEQKKIGLIWLAELIAEIIFILK